MEKILTIVIAIALIGTTLYFLNEGIKLSEKNECYKWIEQEKEYEGFYWTYWQLEQCAEILQANK